MVFSTASEYAVASDRRLTPVPFAESSVSSTCMFLMPIYGFPCSSATGEAKDEHDYSDILTEVTDADEVYAEQCEAAVAAKRLMRSLKRFDSFDNVANETDGSSSTTKMRTRSTTILEPIQESKQLGCTSFWEASEYAELLFDAETPFASDEDLARRSIFAPGLMPEPVTRLMARSHDKSSPAPELLNVSHLRIQPTPAVHEFRDHVSNVLDFGASPVIEQVQDVIHKSTTRREGRSLVYSYAPVFAGDTATEEPWQLQRDPILRYPTGSSLLPGLDHLRNIIARSATIQYDHNIEDLYYATTSFLDDCHDGECSCLDGKMHSLRVPGENFMPADNDDDLGFSNMHPTAKGIFQSIDELVNADMFDVYEVHRGVSEEVLPLLGEYFDTTPHDVKASMVLDQLLYPSGFDAVSLVCNNENDSDVSDPDAESLSSTQHPKLTYVDTDTHQCIAYTALNQLLAMEEDTARPVIHRDTPDEDDEQAEIGLAELVHLRPRAQGHATLLPLRNSSKSNRSSSDFNPGISRPPAPVQPELSLQPTARQRCKPYGLYSSNRSRHQRQLPQLRLATQLLPNHQPLSMVPEEEPSCSSSSSSGESLDFADNRGFVKPLEHRLLGFLDDVDDGEYDLESPMTPISTSDYICEDLNTANMKGYEDLFTDDMWHSTPDLTLTQRSREAYVESAPALVVPPPPLLEALEIEIHSRLTFMFDCMNSGLFNELPALSS